MVLLTPCTRLQVPVPLWSCIRPESLPPCMVVLAVRICRFFLLHGGVELKR